ncbi:hypothetical protein N7516_004077 [Penicillium verrucosum]|uniref:uncharacterized protein n=1 Tax=Penicillium verrucosum TaxID=60171 RepID=UPI0025452344|nr:uncharacterized protein N7516_004077 [Penicillium verrucosum]KAJ5943909.1 hypothetical protein N7516_004077 [Penicillium verrucosum]
MAIYPKTPKAPSVGNGCEQHLVREELWFIHVNQRLGPYQDAIVISTTVCPAEDAITTAEESSPTGPSGNGKGHNSGNGNECTISTTLSTRTVTVTVTQYPATVTDCPARDQTIHITTETVVAAPGAVHNIICSRTGDRPLLLAHTPPLRILLSPSLQPAQHHTHTHQPCYTFKVHRHLLSHGQGFPVTASSPTTAGAGTSSGSTTENNNSASVSTVFNSASSFTVSSFLSALGVIAAIALFL